jgi:predicted amino acid-binding ACT domain protein
VRGAFNAVFVEGAVSGELMLYGRGAGGGPTASAVLGDLVDASRNLRAGAPAPAPKRTSITVRPQAELRSAFYLSMDVADRPGVLAAVAKVFGDHDVSIRAMEQVGLADEARLIFLTHVAREGDLLATIDELRLHQAVDRVSGVLRVIGEETGDVAAGWRGVMEEYRPSSPSPRRRRSSPCSRAAPRWCPPPGCPSAWGRRSGSRSRGPTRPGRSRTAA